MSGDPIGSQPGLEYQCEDGIAWITLDRPERGNALTPGMQPVFRDLWAEVRDNPEVRVAVIAARGERHFCTGFDVSEADGDEADTVFKDAPFAESVHWSPYQNQVWKPVVCVVTGLCVGGGLHFVVDSDIVVASENAAFLDSHVNVGMVGAIENIGLARRLPLGTALRMTLEGRDFRLSADRAYQLGLVDELAPTPSEARERAGEIAGRIAANSPQAMARSKQAIWGGLERSYADALEHGWKLLREHWSHPDFEEGPRAFAEKRAPRWNPDPDARVDSDGPTGKGEKAQ